MLKGEKMVFVQTPRLCGYLSYNAPSKALQEKLGFSYLLAERFTYDGREMEAVENILKRTTWEASAGFSASWGI